MSHHTPRSNKNKNRRKCPVCQHAVLMLVGDGCCLVCHRLGWSLHEGWWKREFIDYDDALRSERLDSGEK